MPKLRLVANADDDGRRHLLQAVGELIVMARGLDLPESVFLLNMAYLDLQTKIHEINDEELEAFAKIVRSAVERL